MIKNQIFDLNRFVSALRKETVENWRTLLLSTVAIYALLAMLMTLGNLVAGDEVARPAVMFRYFIVYMVFSLGGIIVASLAFRGLKTKPGRIELLMSPSSMFEKFMVNAVIYVLGFIVVFPICAQLADLTRIAILWPWTSGAGVPGPINFFDTIHQFAFQQDFWPVDSNAWLEVVLWIGVLASPGLYFMGSILWPRLSFLKTYAAVYAIESVVFIPVMIVASAFTDMHTVVQWMASHFSLPKVMMGMALWSVVQLVLYWTVASWLWKRKDVISLKWWS